LSLLSKPTDICLFVLEDFIITMRHHQHQKGVC
jgi:hypothetical protein